MKQAIKDDGRMLDPVMACYHACHDYPGGLSVVAHMMGVNYNTLQKKLNPTQKFHVLTAPEMVQIMQITGDQRVIDSLCASVDGVFIANDQVPAVAGDVDLVESFSQLISSASAVQVHISQSLSNDGCIDDVEASQLERMQAAMDKAQAMINQLAKQYRG